MNRASESTLRGDNPASEVGPLASEQILRGVHAQVQASVAAGAKLITGGKPIDRDNRRRGT